MQKNQILVLVGPTHPPPSKCNQPLLAERLQNLARQYTKRKEFDCDCDNDYICVCLWSDCDGKARLGQSWVVGWPVAQSEYWSVGFILDIITPFFSLINTKHKIKSHPRDNHKFNLNIAAAELRIATIETIIVAFLFLKLPLFVSLKP